MKKLILPLILLIGITMTSCNSEIQPVNEHTTISLTASESPKDTVLMVIEDNTMYISDLDNKLMYKHSNDVIPGIFIGIIVGVMIGGIFGIIFN